MRASRPEVVHHLHQHTEIVQAGKRMLHPHLFMGMFNLRLPHMVGHHQKLAHYLGPHLAFDFELLKKSRVLTEDSIASRHGTEVPETSSSARDRSYEPSTAGSQAGSSRNTQALQTGHSSSTRNNHEITHLTTTRYHPPLSPPPLPAPDFIRKMTISYNLIVTTEGLLRGLRCLLQIEHRTNHLPLARKPAIRRLIQ